MGSSSTKFLAMRGVQPPNVLQPETSAWLSKLPESARPSLLSTDFARIANALHEQWSRPRACLNYFDDLLIDKRGGRRGFPASIMMELSTLKRYYESEVSRGPRASSDDYIASRTIDFGS
jgi:hypothetical protein